MKRRLLTVTVEVPDSARMLVAVRHLPGWASVTTNNLRDYALAYPDWGYFVAGEQASRSLRPGSRLMQSAALDRW